MDKLFRKTSKAYQESVLPGQIKQRLAVEMGVGQGWHEWVGDEGSVLSIESFGASAPYQLLLEKYGFTVKNIYQKAIKLINKKR